MGDFPKFGHICDCMQMLSISTVHSIKFCFPMHLINSHAQSWHSNLYTFYKSLFHSFIQR